VNRAAWQLRINWVGGDREGGQEERIVLDSVVSQYLSVNDDKGTPALRPAKEASSGNLG
jgi:hypothetical protein